MDPKLTPLPVDATGKLTPTNGLGAPLGTSSAAPARVEEERDLVGDFLAEHPEGTEFDESAAPAAVVPPAPLEVDDAVATEDGQTATEEISPTDAAVETAVVDASKPAAETAPAVDKAASVAADAAPAAAAVAPAAPATYAAEEKIALGRNGEEVVEWTRGQIVEALKERAKFQPRAAEADVYQRVFGTDAATAEKNWAPIVARLAAEPATTDFIDQYLYNPGKADYLNACAAEFDRATDAPARKLFTPAAAVDAPPARPASDPLVREVEEMRRWRDSKIQEEGQAAFNRDMATATSKYPFLATDQRMMQDLILTSQALYSNEVAAAQAEKRDVRPLPFLIKALELKASIYDALLVARAAAENAQPAVAAVPSTLGSPGAAPAASRQTRPKTFKGDLTDAVDDWEANKPAEFR